MDLLYDVNSLGRITLRCMEGLSSTGFSLCAVLRQENQNHTGFWTAPDLRCRCSRSTRLETSTEFMVESRCDALGQAGPIRCRPFRLSVPHEPHRASVFTPRSSNRTCG